MFGLGKLFGGQISANSAQTALYEQITQQSLHPWFYEQVGVRADFTGKFDLSVLHAHLLFERMRRDDQISPSFSQGLFNLCFANWDFALRESGVGDMSVGKHIKRLMQGFYGRAQAFTEALEAKEAIKLDETLRTNLGLTEASAEQMGQIHAYIAGLNAFLWAQDAETYISGSLVLPDPAELAAIKETVQ